MNLSSKMSRDLYFPSKKLTAALDVRNQIHTWADGLRGIVSVTLISSYVIGCFSDYLEDPSLSPVGPTTLFQRPFLRLIVQGQPAVAVSFVLTGFVHPQEIIHLARCGAMHDALSTLASNSFRKAARLVFLTVIVTVMAWLLCQLGAFRLAQGCNLDWLRGTSPQPSQSWYMAGHDLFHELMSIWLHGTHRYDPNLWTLTHLFKGTFLVYTTLLATIFATPRFRLLVEVLLYIWSWCSGYALIRMNVFAGMILAEMSTFLPSHYRSSRLRFILPILLTGLGLFLLSYPCRNPYYASWSRNLSAIGTEIFPSIAKDYRYWHALGAQILCAAILLSPSMQLVLSHRLLVYLGQISLPLYLLHGTLMRIILGVIIYLWPNSSQLHTVHNSAMLLETSTTAFWAYGLQLVVMFIFWTALLAVVFWWSDRIEPYLNHMIAILEVFARRWGCKPSRHPDDSSISPSPSPSPCPIITFPETSLHPLSIFDSPLPSGFGLRNRGGSGGGKQKWRYNNPFPSLITGLCQPGRIDAVASQVEV